MPTPPSFREFLEQDIPARELTKTLDSTLLNLVVLLKYEPMLLESVVEHYETLYFLRSYIQKHEQPCASKS